MNALLERRGFLAGAVKLASQALMLAVLPGLGVAKSVAGERVLWTPEAKPSSVPPATQELRRSYHDATSGTDDVQEGISFPGIGCPRCGAPVVGCKQCGWQRDKFEWKYMTQHIQIPTDEYMQRAARRHHQYVVTVKELDGGLVAMGTLPSVSGDKLVKNLNRQFSAIP